MAAEYAPGDAWKPLLWTPRRSGYTRGEDIADFALETLTATRGFRENEPLELTAWQRWLCDALFEENEDGNLRYRRALIGLPRKNGKSLLGSTIALERLFYGGAGTQIYSAAKDRQQAKIVFGEAKKQVLGNPLLLGVIKPYRDVLENKFTGAIYRALSADGMSAQGLAPEVVIADEIHAWGAGRGEDLWSALTEGSGDREESLVVAISTAGSNKESLLGNLYRHGEAVINGDIEDTQFGLFWWGAPEEADIMLPETWERANPNLKEGLLDYDDFTASLATATTTNLNDFKRYRLNQWVRTDGLTEYITPFQWEKAYSAEAKLVPGEEIAVGFDGSVNDDSTGFVGISLATGTVEVLALWEKDENNPDWAVPRDEVLAAKDEIFAKYRVAQMYCDDSFFRTDVDMWIRQHKIVVKRIPQSNSRMIPITQQFKIAILSGTLKHNNDRALSRHVLNAVEDWQGKIKKDRRHSPRKIDLAVCAILANAARDRILSRRGTRKGGTGGGGGGFKSGTW